MSEHGLLKGTQLDEELAALRIACKNRSKGNRKTTKKCKLFSSSPGIVLPDKKDIPVLPKM